VTHAFRMRFPVRRLIGGVALSAVAIAGAGHLALAAAVAHNSEAPVDFSADHIELQERVDATGHVVVTRTSERATGDVAVYDLNRKLITMVGHVTLHRANGDNLNGGRLVTDLNTGISNIDGHSAGSGTSASGLGQSTTGGRVSGTFNVPKKDDKAAPKP